MIDGKKELIKPIFSNTINSGKILELCQKILGAVGAHINCVCINRDIQCLPHRDKKNDCEKSFFMQFGDFSGCELCIGEPSGIRVLDKKDVFYEFNGKRDLHWNIPLWEGTKYSIVCFARRSCFKYPMPKNRYTYTMWEYIFQEKSFGSRTCTVCNEKKDYREFYAAQRDKSGHMAQCITCFNKKYPR